KKSEKVKLEELALASIRVGDDGSFTINNKVMHLFTDLEVPESLEKEEMVYVRALLCAFADADKCSTYEEDNLPEEHQKTLKRQRRNYYKAESVRRGVRDNFTPDENMEHFESLKEDMFDGVEEVYEDTYKNGLERLNEVLKHSSMITLNGSPLTAIPGLIRNSTKKGICHMLVNDGRISWVYKDEYFI
ncbi:TPA: ABC-three component system protein, partial [Enterococcus faecium]